VFFAGGKKTNAESRYEGEGICIGFIAEIVRQAISFIIISNLEALPVRLFIFKKITK